MVAGPVGVSGVTVINVIKDLGHEVELAAIQVHKMEDCTVLVTRIKVLLVYICAAVIDCNSYDLLSNAVFFANSPGIVSANFFNLKMCLLYGPIFQGPTWHSMSLSV
jgi:hypothetical protein